MRHEYHRTTGDHRSAVSPHASAHHLGPPGHHDHAGMPADLLTWLKRFAAEQGATGRPDGVGRAIILPRT